MIITFVTYETSTPLNAQQLWHTCGSMQRSRITTSQVQSWLTIQCILEILANPFWLDDLICYHQ